MSNMQLGSNKVDKLYLGSNDVTKAYLGSNVVYEEAYSITKSATNGTWSGTSAISAGGTATLTLTPSKNYKLPTSVTVTEATQSWNASTGKLTLSNPTGAVNVIAICPIITYSITETLSNVSKSGTHPTSINAGSSVTLKYAANANYNLPDSVTVTGATSTWTKSTGTLMISNPTGNVTITITAVRITYAITEKLTNVTKTGTHPAFIAAGQTLVLTYTASDTYILPDTITVTGATSDWKQSTGTLTLTNATGAVTITIVGVVSAQKLDTPQNLSISGDILTFDEVTNAQQYEVYVNGTSIGTYIVT